MDRRSYRYLILALLFVLLVGLLITAGCTKDKSTDQESGTGTSQPNDTGMMSGDEKMSDDGMMSDDKTMTDDKMMSGDAGMAHGAISEEYLDEKNPFKLEDGTGYDPTATSAGEKIFKQNCAACHGDKGDGKGPAGLSLDPPPRDFTSEHMQTMDERRMMQVVSEGSPGTAMAPFENTFSETERWQVISYECTLNAAKVCGAAEGTDHAMGEDMMR